MGVPDRVKAALEEYGMLAGAHTVICALSGGADSVCLADVLLALAPELGFRVECAHFNHLLRGEEAQRDEAFVRGWCASRGVKLHVSSGDAAAFAAKEGLGLEEAARVLRYGFLEGLGDGGTRIATAHQAEDQAETVLLNLLRGSGLRGLGGIPPVRGRVIRPLLAATRPEILAYIRERGLSFVEDSSNASDDFRRNKLRHRVLPVLEEIEPAFAENLARAARLLREDEDLLRGEAEKELSREADWVRIPAGRLSELPKPIGARAVLSAAEAFGTRLGSRHAAAVLRLAAEGGPSASLDLPGGLCARRRYGELLIGPKPEPRSLSEAVLTFNGWTELPEAGLRVFWGDSGTETKINGKFTTYFFKKDRICGKITVRPRMEGDVLRLSGGAGSVKKRMIDGKIPAADRALVPVFSDEKGVIAVFGLGADLRAAAAPSEADAVLIVAERT